MVILRIVSISLDLFKIYDDSNFFKIFDEFLQNKSKCRHFENSQSIKKLPRQIYSKLPKVPFKYMNSKKNVIKFYTHLFKDLKDLSRMLYVLKLSNIHSHIEDWSLHSSPILFSLF